MITVGEGFLTYEEAAYGLMLKTGTLYNLVSKYNLPREHILVGSRKRDVVLLPPETIAEIARLTGRAGLIREAKPRRSPGSTRQTA